MTASVSPSGVMTGDRLLAVAEDDEAVARPAGDRGRPATLAASRHRLLACRPSA